VSLHGRGSTQRQRLMRSGRESLDDFWLDE
jgi:hypothetical protein